MANPVMWFEVMGKDSAGLQRFYREVFGWKLTPPVKELGNYSMLERPDTGIGGGFGEGDARVSVYIETADPQRFVDKAVASGATLGRSTPPRNPCSLIHVASSIASSTSLRKICPMPARVPGRLAHCYEALTDALFCYEVTEEYDPDDPDENEIPWDDPRSRRGGYRIGPGSG